MKTDLFFNWLQKQRQGLEAKKVPVHTKHGTYNAIRWVKRGEDPGSKEGSNPDQDLISYLEGYKQTFQNAIQQFKNDFPTQKVYGRVKSVESIKEKMQRSGKPIKDLTDLAGTRIEFKNMKELKEGINKFRERHKGRIIEEKDYLSQPKDYYVSHHFLVKDENDRVIEVQLRTEDMTRLFEWTHETLYKNHMGIDNFTLNIMYDYAYRSARNLLNNGELLPCPPELQQSKIGCP